MLKAVAKRLVEEAVEAKNEVEVELVVVEFTPVKFWKVELLVTRMLVGMKEEAKRLVNVPLVEKSEVEVD